MIPSYKALRQYLGLKRQRVFNAKEEDLLFSKRTAFYAQFVENSGGLMIDVGANIGNRTEVFLNLVSNVVSIEPQSVCADVLRMRFGKRITLLEVGLDAVSGQKTIFESSSHTLSSFSQEWISKAEAGRFSNSVWKKSRAIPMRTLDSIIDEYGVPAFIKIDVEGYEKNILTSLTRPFEYLSFEVNHPENLENTIDIINCLDGAYPSVRFKFSYGESMVFERDEWLSLSDFIQAEKKLFGKDPVWGDIYAMHGKQ